MKVHNNSVYMGDDVRSARHGEGDMVLCQDLAQNKMRSSAS